MYGFNCQLLIPVVMYVFITSSVLVLNINIILTCNIGMLFRKYINIRISICILLENFLFELVLIELEDFLFYKNMSMVH